MTKLIISILISGGYRSAPERSNSKGQTALWIFRGSQITWVKVQEKTPAATQKATVAPSQTVFRMSVTHPVFTVLRIQPLGEKISCFYQEKLSIVVINPGQGEFGFLAGKAVQSTTTHF